MAEPLPRCETVPEPPHRISFRVDGHERLAWHFGDNYPRPFFYPLLGPGGQSLTRMGHPGAPNHDHHQSVWFAHKSVQGVDFWANGDATIRQQSWLAYEDGDEARAGVLLHWFDGHDPAPLLEQQVLMGVRPGPENEQETLLEIDTALTPVSPMLELGKTNFGFLAVRVARSISEYFGDGVLTNDRGLQSEADLFAKPSRWIDYSGPVRLQSSNTVGAKISSENSTEGITFFDHPTNPAHPCSWHVREDGWMGAGATLRESLTLTKAAPLRLRYLLYAHSQEYDQSQAEKRFDDFAASTPMQLVSGRKRNVKHRQHLIVRE